MRHVIKRNPVREPIHNPAHARKHSAFFLSRTLNEDKFPERELVENPGHLCPVRAQAGRRAKAGRD